MNDYSLFDPKYNCEFRNGSACISASPSSSQSYETRKFDGQREGQRSLIILSLKIISTLLKAWISFASKVEFLSGF